MTYEQYAQEAKRTLPVYDSEDDFYMNMLYGIAGELGEVMDIFKKHFFQGHELDREALKDELGDMIWYLTNLMSHEKEIAYNASMVDMSFIKAHCWREPIKLAERDVFNWYLALCHNYLYCFAEGEHGRHLQYYCDTYKHYIIPMLKALDLKISDVYCHNIAKLRKRYPDGFEVERSVNR